MDPIIEEICRARGPQDVRESRFRDWQQYLRTVIQPQLDALAAQSAPTPTREKRTRVTA